MTQELITVFGSTSNQGGSVTTSRRSNLRPLVVRYAHLYPPSVLSDMVGLCKSDYDKR
jgi:hypothetical protein